MRNRISLSDNWQFTKTDVGLPDALPTWQTVTLPHTWNAIDGNDGNGTYYQGRCWYAKEFDTPVQPLAGGRVYLEIPAAANAAQVYLNGQKVVYHEGGYSAFRADVTDLCKAEGKNLLVLSVSNAPSSRIYPQMADFTFFGGLYRGMTLLSVAKVHFALDYHGGPGLAVTATPQGGNAAFTLEAWVKNADDAYTVQYTVTDAEGSEVAVAVRPADDTKVTLCVPNVHLWDVENPYLYTVTASLLRRNETVDEVSTRAGVRSFCCDPQKGFFLNGRPLPLRGVARHQDMNYKGNALSREDHYRDARLIKELGANTVRLAHYQHSQDFYDACDELGLVVWAEIPFISMMNDDPEAHENCRSQMTELIIQNYNHPSICFWGLSNEVLIGGMKPGMVENHKDLNNLVKSLDSTRLTTMAHVSMTPIDSPLHKISDVESYNLYFGWYGGKMEDNGPWLDHFHEVHPDICLGLSEYGTDSIITYHSAKPVCKDYTEEYQALYHEHMAKVLQERPWMWSSHVWNMFDFGAAHRDEGGVQGRNNKGLVTMDRKIKKDAFFIYQAYWTTKPMVHLCGARYAQRAGDTTLVKVYTNQPSVTLTLNGDILGCQPALDHVAKFTVALAQGRNTLVATAGPVADSILLEKVDTEPAIYVLPEFKERTDGVANWFKLAGPLDLNEPMQFPEGYYSIRNTLDELAACDEAFDKVTHAIKLASGRIVEKGVGIYVMMKDRTVESILEEASSMVPEGFAAHLNNQLTKIKK